MTTPTPDQINRAIAEKDGCKYYARKMDGKVFLSRNKPKNGEWMETARPEHRPFVVNSDVEDFHTDGNAIRSAISRRTEEEQERIAHEAMVSWLIQSGPHYRHLILLPASVLATAFYHVLCQEQSPKP